MLDDLKTVTNQNNGQISYEAIRIAMQGKPYPMSLADDREIEVVTHAVNLRIDSRLQSCFCELDSYEAVDNAPKWKKGDEVVLARTLECSVSPDSLPVLLRRLFEDTEYVGEDGDDQDVGSLLAENILMTLGFDETGRLVGREALGLD